MNMDTLMSGSMVKKITAHEKKKKKRYSDTVQYGKFRTNRGSWFTYNFFMHEIDHSDHHPATESSERVDRQARET